MPENIAVPVQTVMFQLAQDSFCGTGNFTRRVDIFYAYQPATLPGASLQIAAERGDQRAKMKLAGRRGGEVPIYCVSVISLNKK